MQNVNGRKRKGKRKKGAQQFYTFFSAFFFLPVYLYIVLQKSETTDQFLIINKCGKKKKGKERSKKRGKKKVG